MISCDFVLVKSRDTLPVFLYDFNFQSLSFLWICALFAVVHLLLVILNLQRHLVEVEATPEGVRGRAEDLLGVRTGNCKRRKTINPIFFCI